MRSLITGACGQDGRLLARQLEMCGHEVLGLDHNYKFNRSTLPVRHGDVRNADEMFSICEAFNPDRIFHLAAVTHPPACVTDPQKAITTNVIGTANVLSWLNYNPKCRVLIAGSSEQIGERGGRGRADELARERPCTLYGVTKQAATNLGRLYQARGLFVSIAILWNHVDLTLPRPESIIVRLAQAAARAFVTKEPIDFNTSTPERVRDYLDATSAASAMRRMLDADEPGTFVIASGHSIPMYRLFRRAEELAGVPFKPTRTVSPPLEAGPLWSIGNPAHAIKCGILTKAECGPKFALVALRHFFDMEVAAIRKREAEGAREAVRNRKEPVT